MLAAACGESRPPTPASPVSARPTAEPTHTTAPTATAARATATPTLPTPRPTHTPTALPTPTPEAATPTVEVSPSPSPPAATSTRSTEELRLTAALDEIDARASSVRELPLFRPVERRFLTREELGERLRQEMEEDRENIYESQRLYVALGAMAPDQDLFELILELLGEGVLGFYDSEEERLYVVKDAGELEPHQERTYVHELIHGIQQQHFDFQAIRDSLEGNSDAKLALRALIEGDATLGTARYAVEYMSPAERVVEPPASPALVRAFRAAPRVIQTQYIFPYQEGGTFVGGLYREGGWQAVDEAFARPPRSTEQVLHPDKYESAEPPLEVILPDLLPALGEGWELLFEDTLGEMMLRAYLGTRFLIADPAVAAAGWGGDRAAIYVGPEDGTVALLSALWDTERDAREFYDAFVRFTVARTGGEWESLDDETALMTLPAQVIAVSIRAAETVAIVAPDLPTLEKVRSAQRSHSEATDSSPTVRTPSAIRLGRLLARQGRSVRRRWVRGWRICSRSGPWGRRRGGPPRLCGRRRCRRRPASPWGFPSRAWT